ncbi:tetratricopeptide repeat-containing sulfotransferase family protein [Thiohalobacter sp.]|uniref:tetratricopeptide repeat-containing sulfotransferase family protein n=1 Tax=Thiohalobacter sp. TaxID=2025948 RepID=UPI00260AA23E|nr:tetratricopeptide repeat-containing sulfotransferase family protein [Thiohalobacter sp.]
MTNKPISHKSILELINKGKPQKALHQCETLLRRSKHDPNLHIMAGSLNAQLGAFSAAIDHFLEANRHQPNNPNTINSLGMAYAADGQFQDAETWFRKALELQPGKPEIMKNLAFTLVKQGKTGEAEALLKETLKLAPNSADALQLLGDIQLAERLYALAIDSYSRALNLYPTRPQLLLQRAKAQMLAGKIGPAIVDLKKATDIDPNYAQAYITLGHAYISNGDPDNARQAFEKALNTQPNNLDALLGIITLDERAGNLDAAFRNLLPLTKTIKNNLELGDIYVRLCHHFDACEKAIEYALQALAQHEDLPKMKGQLHFSLGRHFDRIGNYDAAFEHYQSANSLRPQNYDPEEHANLVNSLITIFSQDFIASAPRSTLSSQKPVFVVGMPRSGTTLTEQILASHPDIYGVGELTDIGDLIQSIAVLGKSGLEYPFSLKDITNEILDFIANNYLARLHEVAPDAPRVIDKYPGNYLHLGLIALAFPGARVIHCRRDPRDTCLSIYFQDFSEQFQYANNLEHAGLHYRQYNKLMEHYRQTLDIPILEVYYEKLVTSPEPTIREMIEFLELEWNDSCLEFHKTQRFIATPSYDQVRKPLYSDSIGRWEHYEKYISPLLNALNMK